jgi:hypothetical protein
VPRVASLTPGIYEINEHTARQQMIGMPDKQPLLEMFGPEPWQMPGVLRGALLTQTRVRILWPALPVWAFNA